MSMRAHADSEAATFIEALRFALKVFELQRRSSLVSTGVNP